MDKNGRWSSMSCCSALCASSYPCASNRLRRFSWPTVDSLTGWGALWWTRWVCGTLVGPMMTNVCLLDQGKEQNKTSSRVQVLNCRQDGISVYRKGFNMNWTHTAWKDTLWYCVVLDENTTCDTGASRIPTGHLGDFSRNILVSSSSWTVHDPWTSMRLQDDAGGESCGCNML